MKPKAALQERIQLMKTAGLLTERVVEVGGSDTIEEFEFDLDDKHYIATLDVSYQMDYSPQDEDYDNYRQQVEVRDLGIDQVGDYQEYVSVNDPELIARVEKLFNTDPEFSERIEDLVDTWGAEESYDDADEYFDDLEEDSDYDMGTPSGDTDAMNIGEAEKKKFSVGDKVKYKGSDWEVARVSGNGFLFRLKSLEGLPSVIVTKIDLREENKESEDEGDREISRGEKIALAREFQILTKPQMAGLFLKALEKYKNEPGNYLGMIPGLAGWGSRDAGGEFKISATRLGDALGVKSPHTAIRTVNKYVNILKGEGSREDELLYPKILKAAEELKSQNPRDLASMVDSAIVDTPPTPMQKRGRPGAPTDLGRRVDTIVKSLMNVAKFERGKAEKAAISKIAKETGTEEGRVSREYQEYIRPKRK